MSITCVVALAALISAVSAATLQSEFVQNNEMKELETVLDNRLRNVLQEFHKLSKEDINFVLLTRKNPQPVLLNNTNLYLIDPKITTVFIIGGWLQFYKTDLMFLNITKAYFQKGDYNVIVVDNHRVMFYPIEVCLTYVQPSGLAVGQFIANIQRLRNVSLSNIHIVGHSIGGNVAAFAGREVIRLTGSKVGRITGLDASHFPAHYLNKNDADIVDAIHTSALVGIPEPIGTVNFYPNSDDYTLQPGCTLYPSTPLKNWTEEIEFVFCSHHKSVEYFIKTLNSIHKAVKCQSFKEFQEGKCQNNELAIFGENYVPGPEGKFYLYLVCSETACVSKY